MDHSYEEIRDVALDILAGREQLRAGVSQYQSLLDCVAETLENRDAPAERAAITTNRITMSKHDREIFLEAFWELFRQGIITLGCDDSNREFPFFHVSEFGKKMLESHDGYFFHDVSTYEKVIRQNIPGIHPTTLMYLKEALQAFRAGCILSCSVMLGVAAEHTFLLLLDAINNNKDKCSIFAPVDSQRTILGKIMKFKALLQQNPNEIPSGIREDFDTHLMSILSVIRTSRNQSGHPTGQVLGREQAYIYLYLFIPYCKKMCELREFYGDAGPTTQK